MSKYYLCLFGSKDKIQITESQYHRLCTNKTMNGYWLEDIGENNGKPNRAPHQRRSAAC